MIIFKESTANKFFKKRSVETFAVIRRFVVRVEHGAPLFFVTKIATGNQQKAEDVGADVPVEFDTRL